MSPLDNNKHNNPIRIARFSDDIFALEGVGSDTVR